MLREEEEEEEEKQRVPKALFSLLGKRALFALLPKKGKKKTHKALGSHHLKEMGEEEKVEEKKEEGAAEEKKEVAKEEEKKEEAKKEEPPEIVIRVDMHCEGCARKVARSLRGFEGVEEVKTDSKSRKVVVKGKEVDPIKVCERVQKKTGRKAELISPLPKPPEEEKKEESQGTQQEEKKEEPKPITVVLKVMMHCDACAQALQKRIKKMDGVESVVTDLSNDQVTIKGFVDPVKLVENVSRRTKKQAAIVKDEEKKEEENKKEEQEKKEEKDEEEKKDEEGDKKIEAKKFENFPPKYYIDYAYPPPQIFSDENPNACSVM